MPSAPGIPERLNQGDLSTLPLNQLVDYALQLHDAQRAGRHYDLRIGTPDLGHFSWAIRKGLPEPGQKHLSVRQPLHDPEWAKFQGEVPAGHYGAGRVRLADSGQALLTKVSPEALHFTTAHQRYPERYALVRAGQNPNNWLMLNTTPTDKIPYNKVHYKSIPKEKAEEVLKGLGPDASVQAKIDGAAALTQLGKALEVASYRTSKQTGRPIIHSERLFGGRVPTTNIPKELIGTVLRGELYGVKKDTGKAIPPQELGGILNASIANALKKQEAKNIELKKMVFNIQQYGNKPVPPDTPYDQKKEMIRQVLQHLPAGKFHMPEEAKTPEDAWNLWKQITSGKHPLTDEGVVVHGHGDRPAKIKNLSEQDVYVRGHAPGQGKYLNNGIGAIRYSTTPSGPVVGEVGTGLSDELRRDFYANPGLYLGRRARVRHQGAFPSGALRAPSLLALHEDY